MSTRTHLFIVAVAVVAMVLVLRLVASRQLRSKYALLWLTIATGLVIVAAFPGLLDELADLTGIDYAPTLFLLLAVGVLGLLVAHLTWEVSRLEMRIRTLAEDHALLRAALDDRAAPAAPPEGRPPPPAAPLEPA
jgi:hypothetical protein